MTIQTPEMSAFVEDLWTNVLGITDPAFGDVDWENPAVFGGMNEEEHGEEAEPVNAVRFFHFVGDQLSVEIPEPIDENLPIQWFKDGQPMSNLGGLITGTQGRLLEFFYLEESDSGTYLATYDDGSKAPATFGFGMQVVQPGALPAASGLGIAALIGGLCAGGLLIGRRK